MHEMKFIESSAKDNNNIREIFNELTKRIILSKEETEANGRHKSKKRTDSIVLNSKKTHSNNDCKC